MKLAEALQERADLNRKIEQLRARLQNNALVQEGDKTQENPEMLMKEMETACSSLCALIIRINKTNCATCIDDGTSLVELIARRDTLKTRLEIYRDIVSTASQTARRAMRSEIRILSAVDVPELQKTADNIARQIRLVDNQLQEMNWKTELL